MATRVPHILVVGSLNTDLITRTSKVPVGGQTLTASSFATGSGGKGANQAVACARASRRSPTNNATSEQPIAKVSMIGAVGEDAYGRQLLDDLSNNGVNVDGISVLKDEVSGVAVIIVEEATGENRILVTPGANEKVTAHAFDTFVAREKPDLVVLQLETPLDAVLAVIASAKKQGIEVLLNPAPALGIPEATLRGLDHLIMNETEAEILAPGTILDNGWGGRDRLECKFEMFEAFGVRNTIITLGGKGVSYGLGKGELAKLPAGKVSKVVDTTAAGDTFVGAYAVEVARSKAAGESLDIKLAVEKANRAAARTVEKAGAMVSIPWMDEVGASSD